MPFDLSYGGKNHKKNTWKLMASPVTFPRIRPPVRYTSRAPCHQGRCPGSAARRVRCAWRAVGDLLHIMIPMKVSSLLRGAALACACLCSTHFASVVAAGETSALRVLFLGDRDHHRPADRFKQLEPVLREHRIELDYSESLVDLNPAKLAGYDCLMIYANWTKISPEQEKALLDFVAAGGGFAPIHCASYCFLNSPKYIELVGGQFKSHGTGVFRETIAQPDHPVMKGLAPIESWDETYVHTKHNTNRLVLAERRDDKGAEPYTWVRQYGKGRVFYTAWGHDERTWSNAGFQALVENGVRWASANSSTQLKPSTGLKPFEYTEASAPLPNYTPNAQWG